MNRTLFFFALVVCVAAALVQPGTPMRAAVAQPSMARATAPNMVVDAEVVTTLSQVSQALASNSGDFGGYTLPIIGLGTLSAIIALLAGPVED